MNVGKLSNHVKSVSSSFFLLRFYHHICTNHNNLMLVLPLLFLVHDFCIVKVVLNVPHVDMNLLSVHK